jgi:hypothetical protein
MRDLFAVQCTDRNMRRRRGIRFALATKLPLLLVLVTLTAQGQDRARDTPFSCEPVVPGSIVFRGFALENYDSAEREQRLT